MTAIAPGQVTALLGAWSGGDEELRRLARRYVRREPARHTLQTTAPVNEAYLRLVDLSTVDWNDRAHFYAVAAQMMRRTLVDAARARASVKRGAAATRVSLDGVADDYTHHHCRRTAAGNCQVC